MNAQAQGSTTQQTPQDISSILDHVKGLEEEKAKLMKMLEDQKKLTEKMSEGKRLEMKKALDTVIMNWLKDSVQDEKIREEFTQGMNRLVENTAEDSGVWQVVCCASNVHARHLQEIEQMRLENETLKTRGSGEFRDEASRKRPRDDAPAKETGNIWTDFESDIRTNGIVYTHPQISIQ